MKLKNLLFSIYIIYIKYSPVNKGKYSIGKLLTNILGEISIKVNNVYLYIIPHNSMDLSYFKSRKSSHSMIEKEIEKLKPAENFIDVGANIGYFSFLASNKVGKNGKVFSFEPSFREYRRLLSGIRKNNAYNIIPFNLALGNEREYTIINISSDNHSGLNSFIKNDKNFTYQYCLTDYLDNYIINNYIINLMKIDVEGFEMRVLLGMKNLLQENRVKKLIIEITPSLLEKDGYSKTELYSYLQNFGYYGEFANNEEWQYDEIFYLKE